MKIDGGDGWGKLTFVAVRHDGAEVDDGMDLVPAATGAGLGSTGVLVVVD